MPSFSNYESKFLIAFEKREKEYDDASERFVDIDKTVLDVIDVPDDDEGGDKSKSKDAKKTDFSYTTTTVKIALACGAIGPVVNLNIILDDSVRSSNRAYILFEDHETALACVSKMNDKPMDGRTMHVHVALTIAAERNKVLTLPRSRTAGIGIVTSPPSAIAAGKLGTMPEIAPTRQ